MAMHGKRKGIFLAVIACLGFGCDAHDYWALPDQLEVNSEEGILTASNTESLNQDLFVRYQFDYEVQNLSSQPTEVVVSATSYVNTIERVSGQKVWYLEPDELGQGILTTSQLELGNMLVVNLSCCEASQCSRNEVLCPETEDWTVENANAMASFCYRACKDPTSCILQCPDDEACETHCNDAMRTTTKEEVASCLQQCPNDSCLETCRTTHEDEDDQLACISRCPLTCEQTCESALEAALATCQCSTEEYCQEACQGASEADQETCIRLCLDQKNCQICKELQQKKWAACIHSCPAESECQTACNHLEADEKVSCLAKCASSQTCKGYCEADIKAKCRKQNCDYGGEVATCAHKCINDPDCYLESCQPTSECQETCTSMQASCYRNCISTIAQCTDSFQYTAETKIIPCALCGGEGTCLYDVEDNNPTLSTRHSNGQKSGVIYACDLDCSRYPSTCVTGCNDLYSDDESRMECLHMCLNQHLFWCNDYEIPTDYIDSNGYQPCCYSDSCYSSLTGVVKTYDVECFNDTSCSSGKYCSSEGICVSSGSSSCQSSLYSPRHRSVFWLFILSFGVIFYRTRKGFKV